MSDFETLSSCLTADRIMVYGVLVADLHPADFYVPDGKEFPSLTDIAFQIVVRSGSMEIEIDNERYECSSRENNLVDVKPLNRVTGITLSPDFRGWMVALSRQFIDAVLKGRKPIRVSEIMSLRMYTAITLPAERIAVLDRYYSIVKESAGNPGDRLDATIFCYAVVFLHLNMLKTIRETMPRPAESHEFSRTALILEHFFSLIEENVHREHEVAFYADKLNITPHYLTMVTNRFTGRSASKVISEALMSRAYAMLRNPDYSIQEIADRLHFSDQSSFGKFFRKHSGTTPASYRRSTL